MVDMNSFYDENLKEMIDKATDLPIESDAAVTAMKNLVEFSKVRVAIATPEPAPTPVPTTRLGKFWAGTKCAFDNETTRALIKAGGAFAGVLVVANATIRKDHVMERQALAQANQPPPR